ncbi:MAG TPA: DUF1328 domain-containing protein [Planctomycetota bacterium]|nr:DUF1328 domain-containing protein [Planctomycetota bacterium]
MRLWSLGFLAIAVLAAFVGFWDDREGLNAARVLLGVALLVFAISLFSGRGDENRDGHHDH